MTNLNIKSKLVIIFVLIKIIPLVLFSYIALLGVLKLDEYFSDNTEIVYFKNKNVLEETVKESIENSINALDDKAQLNLEKQTVQIAQRVADFLYERDNDLLLLSSMSISDEILKQFFINKNKEVLVTPEYEYDSTLDSWIRVSKELDTTISTETQIIDNEKKFRYIDTTNIKRKKIPIYKEISYFDLDGQEIYKYSNINNKKIDISKKENTYINAEEYYNQLKNLKKGEIYVSNVIGEYVGSNIIGTYNKKKTSKKNLKFLPQEQGYAGLENPIGKKFNGIVRFVTPVFKEGNKIGYISLALDHTHIMEFTDTFNPSDNFKETDISDASIGNYAFMWDEKGRNISHVRDYFIVGYDKITGEEVPGWLSADVYKDFKESNIDDLNSFLSKYPTFKDQSLKNKPNVEQIKKGELGLDCRYLNFAPQCKGWMDLTQNGGYGSFIILWSNVWKLTTAATIPYYTGKYSDSKRGFGFVTIGANVDEFHSAATKTKEKINAVVSEQTTKMEQDLKNNKALIKEYISETINELSIYTILMIIIVVIIAIILSNYISNKIIEMITATNKFSKGDFTYQIDVKSSDEIGQLGTSINKMGQELGVINKNITDMLDATLEMIILSDERGIIIDINKAGIKMLGYTSKDELVGKKILDLVTPEDSEKVKQAIETKNTMPYELTINKKDGKVINAINRATYIEVNGKSTRMSSILDLSEINKIKKILHEQTRLAQMGEMISMIAHQWRQPLSAISSTSIALKLKLALNKFNLEDANEREEFKTFTNNQLDNINKYVITLSSTIDDFRNFFKPEKEKELVSIIEPVNKALKIVETSMSNKGITIKSNFKTDDKVFMYQNEMMQVILNILKNSEDNFIEKNIKNRKIDIVVENDSKAYQIVIQDNGGGIDEKIIDKIFDPYFSTKTKKDGTGLGLYMSKTIIEDHCEGILNVQNIEEGVEFIIRLGEIDG